MGTPDLAESLRRVVDATVVTKLTQLSGGASRETYSFEADGRPLVLQRQRPGADRLLATEVAALRAAASAGVPVAAVIAASDDASPLGAPYMVATNVPGETIARRILRDSRFAGARARFATDVGTALATLHTLAPEAVDGLDASDQVAQYRSALDSIGHPHPTFELVFQWLDANRPAPSPRTVVHGDFRLGNLIVNDDGLAAVLDWELVHAGDPLEDLAWLCVRAWRFGGAQPVAGLASYDELINAYEAAGGRRVDRAALRWWEVLGTLKWGIMCMMQTSAHLLGLSRSHELAAIGRRVCENEYDLFMLLDGVW